MYGLGWGKVEVGRGLENDKGNHICTHTQTHLHMDIHVKH